MSEAAITRAVEAYAARLAYEGLDAEADALEAAHINAYEALTEDEKIEAQARMRALDWGWM